MPSIHPNTEPATGSISATASSTALFDSLARSSYVSIESYRRSGKAAPTPVWIVADGDKLFCWTLGNSGKVKRIRANPRVRLTPCDAAGKIKGDWVAAQGRVLQHPAEIGAQARRMRRKYGLKFLPFRILPYLRGTKPAVIEFRLT